MLNDRASRLHDLLRHIVSVEKTRGTGNKGEVMSAGEIDRALQQLVFENIELSEVDSSGLINPPEQNGGRLPSLLGRTVRLASRPDPLAFCNIF